ncbi:MAG: TIGR04255 family protein [Nostoc sp. DedQUE04]|uniref:TIGR04255 family protein n=1 Tax=Nostoc sp. DedQUE04 TaxID=3075390 RepID=UPI002AD45FC0|nr:TIGR04255 family protein [Nostoc sp. DedQUE04]MDZ8138243.1 TIGR04255 family protein [Nostoc sp. DedQUE04]
MTRRQYSNPPIEEAVCELRFAPGQAWNFTVPGLFYEKARDLYTGEPSEQNSIATEFKFSRMQVVSPEVTLTQDLPKFLFPSADGTKLVGVGPNLLSIHSLRPYEGWDEFSKRIEQALQLYLEVAKPVGITRISLRYINRIVISSPDQAIDLSDYVNIYPQLPDDLPSHISEFVTQAELIYEDIPAKLAITLSDSEPQPGEVVFILDLDISQAWVEKPLSFEEVLSNLHELKSREGQVFESLITDRTRELFDVK